jgi:hypothetical protein
VDTSTEITNSVQPNNVCERQDRQEQQGTDGSQGLWSMIIPLLQHLWLSISVLLVLIGSNEAAVLKTRWNPVVLTMVKGHQLTANGREKGDHQGRTKPQLFQQIMGLVPGSPFTFNMDKWRSIVSSGLFHNLTANTVNTVDGVYLNVSGYETSSIMLSPEITVTTSLENPEIVGGVCIPVRVLRTCFQHSLNVCCFC